MAGYAATARELIVAALEPHRDQERARWMSTYMRGQFPFLGIETAQRRAFQKTALSVLPAPAEPDLTAFARALYELPEREYQYIAVDHLVRWVGACGAGFLPVARELVTTKSWWDTVDGLAAQVVGPLVMA